MLEVKRGSLVISRAGRDKGRLLVVLAVESGAALVADGSLRSLGKPKRKKLRHLAVTSGSLELDGVGSDRQLRNLLANCQQRNPRESE